MEQNMIEEILPDLYRIEIPLPNSPLKSVNSYLLISDRRNLAIDTGFNQPTCLETLRQAYHELDVDLTRTDFLSTHLHVDHHGLVGKLAEPDAKKYMGKTDAQLLEKHLDWQKILHITAISGFSVEKLQFLRKNHPMQKLAPDFSIRWDYVQEGDSLSIGNYTVTCLETPGHTWGHICLWDTERKILFSGDHILGDITSNIQVWDFDDDPLASYMTNLDRISGLEIQLVLPGHRSIIRNCGSRIEALKRHHMDRCNEVLDILETSAQNAEQTAAQMTWDIKAESWDKIPVLQQWFATGEAVAHLRFLANKGLVAQEIQKDGVILYSITAEAKRLKSMD